MSILLNKTARICIIVSVAALIVVALFAVKRQNTLPEWEVVGRFHKLRHDVYPSEQGFLYRNQANLYIMCDWQGRERWRVTIDSMPKHRLTKLTFSPSGLILVTIHTVDEGFIITTYRDGKEVGSATLLTPYPFRRMQVFDNGRVLLVLNYRIYLIEKAKTIAEYKHPHAEGISISQSGTAMVAPSVGTGKYNFVYSTCTIDKGRFLFGKELHIKVQLQYPNAWLIYNDGTAIFSDGTVITPAQQFISTDGWNTITRTDNDAIVADYLIQYRGDPPTEYRFFNPMTLDQWQCKLSNPQQQATAIDISRNARTVMLRIVGNDTESKLARNGYYQEPGAVYCLYRRNSGFIANMSANRINRLLGKEQFVGFAYLSPDSQMLLVDPGFVGREEEESNAMLLRIVQK